MSYVVGNAGVIKDPYVVEELDRIQAALKGFSEIIATYGMEKPDLPLPTTKGDPTNPDRTTPSPTIGVRWPTGPWLIGVDGDGAMPKIPSYAVQFPAPMSTDQHNFALDAAAIIVELIPTAAIDLTGLKQANVKQRRMVGVLNRGSFSLSVVNQSTDSESANRFSWGDTGDAGETIVIPTGVIVWFYYAVSRWKLFAIPAVGGENLPPSIVPPAPDVPPVHHWFSAQVTINNSTTGLVGLYENAPAVAGATAAITVDSAGVGRQSTTGNVAGDLAGVSANGIPPLVRGIFDYTWTTIMRTDVASLADTRLWVVLSTNAPSNADDYGGNIVGFRYSSVAADGGWVGVCRDGAAQSVTGTVGSIAVNTLYKLKVRKSGSTVYFSVNDGTEVAHTTNLPLDATSLVWYCYVITNAAATKTLTWYRHSLRGALEP